MSFEDEFFDRYNKKCEDGTRVPEKINFENAHLDKTNRTFTGTIILPSPLFKIKTM